MSSRDGVDLIVTLTGAQRDLVLLLDGSVEAGLSFSPSRVGIAIHR